MRTKNRTAALLFLGVCSIFAGFLGFGLSGCGRDDQPGEPGQPPMANIDRDIAATLNAANEGEIQISQLGKEKSMNMEVKGYAERMATEHQQYLERQSQLFIRNNILPTENVMSQQLRRDVSNQVNQLREESDATFDRVFMDGQVALHERVLKLIDEQLLPNARNDQLRTELMMMRTGEEEHLRTAKDLQGRLPPLPMM